MIGILNKAIGGIFGSKKDRDMKELSPFATRVSAEYTNLQSLSNDELRSKTADFKRRIAEHLTDIEKEISELEAKAEGDPDMDLQEKEEIYRKIDALKKDRNKQTEEILLELLPEAFAVVKETARRFTENETLTVTATDLDRDLATKKDNVTIEGDKAVYDH